MLVEVFMEVTVLCRALSWTLCSLSGTGGSYFDFLANVVCPTNSLSTFQFNSLFFIYSFHKYCVILIKELNGHDPLKRKNLCANLQFPLQGLYVEIIWCNIWSLFHIVAQIHTEIFYIPCVREALYCKNEMCEGRWSFVSPWWMQIFTWL